MDAIKFSWFVLHSTVVPKDQTPAFVANTMDSATSQSVKVRSSPPSAAFGGARYVPAFVGNERATHGGHYDARDERIGAAHGSALMHHHHQYYDQHSASAASFGLSHHSPDFTPPRHHALRTAPSYEKKEGDEDVEEMPALPSVPPSSSVHVSYAPTVAHAAAQPADTHQGDYTYDMYDGQQTAGFDYTPYQYPHAEVSSYHEELTHDQRQVGIINDRDVTDRDVKFGRGGGTNRHPGNLYFRKLVAKARHEYLVARKTQKGQISRDIVAAVRARGGRWLKMDSRGGTWEDVGDDDAAKKVSQALREGLALKRRQALMASVSTKRSLAYPQYRGSPDEGKCRARSTSSKRARVQE